MGAEDRRKLEQWFSTATTKENETEKIAAVKALFEKANAHNACQEAVNQLFAQAETDLKSLASQVDATALRELQSFTAKLLGREF